MLATSFSIDNLVESILRAIVDHLKNEESAFIFQRPVDNAQFPKYRTIISSPMDLQTITRRIESNYYNDFLTFHEDVLKIFHNGCTFNPCYDIWYQQCVVLKMCYMNIIESMKRSGLYEKLVHMNEMPIENETVVRLEKRDRDGETVVFSDASTPKLLIPCKSESVRENAEKRYSLNSSSNPRGVLPFLSYSVAEVKEGYEASTILR